MSAIMCSSCEAVGESSLATLYCATCYEKLESELRAAVAERDKWRAWKPDDEDLAMLKEQAMNRDGNHNGSLAACVVYIGALEARLRERDAAIARGGAEERESIAEFVKQHYYEYTGDYINSAEEQLAAAIRAR